MKRSRDLLESLAPEQGAGSREQGAGSRGLGWRSTEPRQATRPGVSPVDSVDNRHNVIRRGEREPIPFPARLGVIRRDGWVCQICFGYTHTEFIELDHVIPWSAGGPDTTDNLRVTCRPCNRARSNYVDSFGEDRHRLPVTWWCTDCADPYEFERGIAFTAVGEHSECWACRQAWWAVVFRPGHVPDELRLECAALTPLAGPVLAFCAHCDTTGYTRFPL